MLCYIQIMNEWCTSLLSTTRPPLLSCRPVLNCLLGSGILPRLINLITCVEPERSSPSSADSYTGIYYPFPSICNSYTEAIGLRLGLSSRDTYRNYIVYQGSEIQFLASSGRTQKGLLPEAPNTCCRSVLCTDLDVTRF